MKLLYMFCVLKFNDYIIKIRRNNFNSNQTAELCASVWYDGLLLSSLLPKVSSMHTSCRQRIGGGE